MAMVRNLLERPLLKHRGPWRNMDAWVIAFVKTLDA